MALADSATRLYMEDRSFSWAYSTVISLVHSAWASNPEAALPYLEPLLEEFRSADTLREAPRFMQGVLGLFATAYALAGELAPARALLAAMDSLAATADFHPAGIAEHARAVVALEEGRPEASLQHLERARASEFGLLHDYSRFLLGDVNVALGRLPEAAAEYEITAGTLGLNFEDARAHPPLQPISHERLGRLYLTLGDTATALTHLGMFVELWNDADSDLQPRVSEARRQMQEILSRRG
jgi:tetratricopeptide (TPR) repeat protein